MKTTVIDPIFLLSLVIIERKIYAEQTFWNVLEFYQQLGFQVIPPATEVPD